MTLAAAAEPTWYRKDSVTAQSALFRDCSERSRAALHPVETALERTDAALASLDLSLGLLRGSVDERQHDLWRARLDERSSRFGNEFEAVQAQLDDMTAAYEREFEAALQRALAKEGAGGAGKPTECPAKSDPFASLGPPGTARGGPSCPGTDVSASLAAAWDADASLRTEIERAADRSWPPITSYGEAADALALSGQGAAGGGWVDPAALARALPEAAELLDDVERRARRAREALQEARTLLSAEDPSAKEKATLIREKARGIREFSDEARQVLGRAIWSAVDRARGKGKKAGWSEAGACPNPAAWGACRGVDRTAEVRDALLADKRLAKEIQSFMSNLKDPNTSIE
jgi:hypothetical protein